MSETCPPPPVCTVSQTQADQRLRVREVTHVINLDHVQHTLTQKHTHTQTCGSVGKHSGIIA